MNKKHRVIIAGFLIFTATASLSACGAKVEATDEAKNTTVVNCGIEQSYPSPQNAVAYDTAIEAVFSLGLADRMRGIVMPRSINSVIANSPYKADYEKVETLSDDVLSQETLVNAGADWAYAGWRAGFAQNAM